MIKIRRKKLQRDENKIAIKNQNFDNIDNIDRNSSLLVNMHCIQYMNHDKHLKKTSYKVHTFSSSIHTKACPN